MKLRMKLLACAAAVTGFVLGAAALGVTRAEAESSAELFLPASYEQYLPLTAPSDAAMNDSHIVISDGSSLYVYDRDAVAWYRYDHAPFGGEPRTITKIGFTSDGRLFFSDQDTHLFLFNFTTKEAQIQSAIPCSTFIIDGDTLYTAAVANGRTTFLAFPHRGAGLSYERRRNIGSLEASTSIAPHMFVKDGVLYCAINSYVHAYRDNGSSYDHTELLLAGGESVQDLTSAAVFDGQVYYTVNGVSGEEDGLYAASLNGPARKLLDGDGFNALTSYGGDLYCVKGASVRKLKIEEDGAGYTDYEIAAESDSYNRLSGATESVRARDLVVTADCDNRRVSVYHEETKQFTVLDTGVANCVATDGEVIAAGVGNSVLLYRYGESAPYYIHNTANAVTGLAVIFGRCYYVTEHHYGVAEEGASEFTRSNAPTALTNDVYGNLYVADQKNRVIKYTEEQFLDPTVEDGVVVTETGNWTLPAGYRSLRADYDGNLYYLYENAVYRNGERLASMDAADCVYRGEREMPELSSFALGFEDNRLYLQYGSFMAIAKNVDFPTLSTIAAGNAQEEIFRTPDRETLSLVDVKSGVTGIGVDAAAIGASNYFPYTDYYRTAQGGRGVLLAERGKFSLIALFEDHDYTVALYLTEDCTPAPVVWNDRAPETFYTTSEIALSYYPCLSAPLTIERLPRASELVLLAEVKSDGNFDFAYVRSGNTLGYLPLSYLTATPPLSPAPDEFTLGYLKASEDGVLFRSAEGQTLLVNERTQVKIYEGQNGLYFVRLTKDGVEYTAQVTEKMIQTGDPDALRISLIIVLSVVAVGIVGAYVLFRPRKKRE